ncbi:hypothetical protein E2562_006695 [Oryza meyeriana var. granulata]|uniref:Uncharacterized protein n=1 Tax=Oryza meyeriana var. granulata TaxID=110450 RepID=A0A6G1EH32_9ORYZ|nr:hypothetical protein E2562_006695 [Oryza meyeriana var. granulata]
MWQPGQGAPAAVEAIAAPPPAVQNSTHSCGSRSLSSCANFTSRGIGPITDAMPVTAAADSRAFLNRTHIRFRSLTDGTSSRP